MQRQPIAPSCRRCLQPVGGLNGLLPQISLRTHHTQNTNTLMQYIYAQRPLLSELSERVKKQKKRMGGKENTAHGRRVWHV
jgi:hypothetical protein